MNALEQNKKNVKIYKRCLTESKRRHEENLNLFNKMEADENNRFRQELISLGNGSPEFALGLHPIEGYGGDDIAELWKIMEGFFASHPTIKRDKEFDLIYIKGVKYIKLNANFQVYDHDGSGIIRVAKELGLKVENQYGRTTCIWITDKMHLNVVVRARGPNSCVCWIGFPCVGLRNNDMENALWVFNLFSQLLDKFVRRN